MACEKCCDVDECHLHCDCSNEGLCEQPELAVRRGGRCLCGFMPPHLSGAECDHLRDVDEPCGTVHVDLQHGVPLACVILQRENDCGAWAFGKVDACGPRRLVKGNDLLYGLIQGCDLTRIESYGWSKWHRQLDPPVPWHEFDSAFGAEESNPGEYITKDFWVQFSRPVRKDCLKPDCFVINAFFHDREGGWRLPYRVPIIGVDTTRAKPQKNDPIDHVRSATVIVDGTWLGDAVRGGYSYFQDCEAWIEIEVRGDFMVDCNGQAVDANAIGCTSHSKGNGTPGGSFVSTFRVEQAPTPTRPRPRRATRQP